MTQNKRDPVIARMTSADLPALAQIEAASFSQPWSAQALQAELQNPTALFLVAHVDGQVAGYAGIHCLFDTAQLENLAVAPSFRRQGIARALLQAGLQAAEQAGATQLLLEVRVSNTPAIALYRSCGFAVLATRRGFYEHPREDAYTMQCLLMQAAEQEARQ